MFHLRIRDIYDSRGERPCCNEKSDEESGLGTLNLPENKLKEVFSKS
jgi:hypothetical protein